jgi:S-formylglutathione hydrolase
MKHNKGIAIVMPDTSPRNDESVQVPNVDSYDLGIGAGFYINATTETYAKHYQMYNYITKELPEILSSQTFNIGKDGRKSISGHSMGGHGALTIALREGPTIWKSVSAFAPICNPVDCPWGQKAFTEYLGSVDDGKVHDATCLLLEQNKQTQTKSLYDDILIDQGTADNFLKEQLKPEAFVKAAETCGQNVTLNMRNGFDHSYYFIAAFIESHVEFHGQRLNQME